jgi:HTH-type transcriptional regulator/antitoxin HigA
MVTSDYKYILAHRFIMKNLTYTIIKNDKQYKKYCNILEDLVSSGLESQKDIDEYGLLNLLISDWDEQHRLAAKLDPIELLKALMEDHGLNQTELADIEGVGKSYMSEILTYKKRMSKRVIRNIASNFKIRQEVLNRPYWLIDEDYMKNESKGKTIFSTK